jgi:hypothetical protein
MFRQHEAPLYRLAFQTREGTVFEAGDRHGIVLDRVNENHFTAARHTTHRTHSY